MSNIVNEEKSTAWEIIGTFIKWRRLLVMSFIAAALLTLIISFFMPKYYTSTASLFPPEKDSGSIGLSSLLSGGLSSMLSGSGMSLPAFATLSDVYASILKSRIVSEGVLDKNNLMEVYEIKSREEAVKKVQAILNITVQPDGIINISCEDKDPERAKVLVESFIEELNRINSEVRVSKATTTRQFIEGRLNQSQVDLAAAEVAYKQFQEQYKTVSLDAQVNALITNLAELKKQMVAAEIELGMLKRTLLPSHMQVKQKEAEIAEIKKQIAIIEQGLPGDGENNNGALGIPFSEAPELGLQLVRLTRELKIQEAIYELLTQQFEEAKINELRDSPSVQVLDPPKVPERKSRPKRIILSLMAGILSSLMTTMAVFGMEFIERNKQANTQTYRNLENILGSLKSDYYALRTFFMSKKRRNI